MKRYMIMAAVIAFNLAAPDSIRAKPPIPTPEDTPMMGEMDAYLLETLYEMEDTDAGLKNVLDQDRFQTLIGKHNLKLFSGPMLGRVTDTGARFWVRTAGAAHVQAVVSKEGDSSRLMKTGRARTSADADFTALLDIGDLEPFSVYHYDILVDGESVFQGRAPSFRTYPAQGQGEVFDIGFGGGARYIPENERMWDVIASRKPAAFLFLGDNVYIDLPLSRTKQRVHYYRRQLRPEYRRFTSATSVYAIYDDHDFGVNDCAGGLDPFLPEWKVPAWRVFKENWNNPYYGGGEQQPGCWFDFSIGDVDVFMIDNRYYRSFKDGTMMGPAQKQWLLDKLKASTATFKVLASGTLWTEHADKGGADSWWGVKEEREELFSFIEQHNIGGVILLSADRHRTDVYRIERPNGYDFYEFETSRLTNLHSHPTNKKALFSDNKGHFFGLLTFDMKKKDPEVTFRCITIENEERYALTLKRSQLEAKARE